MTIIIKPGVLGELRAVPPGDRSEVFSNLGGVPQGLEASVLGDLRRVPPGDKTGSFGRPRRRTPGFHPPWDTPPRSPGRRG